MFLYKKNDKFYVKEIVRYYNSCPNCNSEDIIALFREENEGKVKDLSSQELLSKNSLHYLLHKENLLCKNCGYYDFLDAFLERDLIMSIPSTDMADPFSRAKYLSSLREKFSSIKDSQSVEFVLEKFSQKGERK